MNFFKTTIIGGVVFLVPVVIVAAIVGKALQIMLLVAKPLENQLPVDMVGGVALANITALLAIVLVCFAAGVIAKSKSAIRFYQKIDLALLAVPGYAFVKGYIDSTQASKAESEWFFTVLVQLDDNSQLGFEIERLENGQVVVYLPGAPNPWSGSVVYFAEERVIRLDISPSQAFNNIRRLGVGTKTLKGLTQF